MYVYIYYIYYIYIIYYRYIYIYIYYIYIIYYIYYIYILYIIYIYILYIIYIYYIYIYIIYIYVARGLTFARNPRNSMQDCNPLCSLGACFLQTTNIQNIDMSCVSWHFLRLPKMVPKSPFEACFKDILRNLRCFKL